MKKFLLGLVFIFVSILSFGIDKAYFVDEWECTAPDYRAYFQFYEGTLIVQELDVEESPTELLIWWYEPERNVLVIEYNEYEVHIVDENTFMLNPIDTEKDWMENMEFKFKRISAPPKEKILDGEKRLV